MEEWLRAAALGAIQALTEFLPISSSGHLVVAHRLFGEGSSPLTFDVGLHAGTLAAILLYFWVDWYRIAGCTLGDLRQHRVRWRDWSETSMLGVWIAIATLPAVAAGVLFGDVVEERLRDPVLVAVLLIVAGIAIAVLDREEKAHELDRLGGRHAFMIGVAQALALVPGVSRSGATIAAARGLGYGRPDAARFSFLLAAPITLGAVVAEFGSALSSNEAVAWGPLVLGAVVAFLIGMLVIRFLLRFVATRTLMPFVWYRLALGAVIIVSATAGWL